MALIAKTLFQGYFSLFGEKADERANNFPFMSSPLYPCMFCLGYLYFVRYIGPELMKNRPAYNLKSILIAYNTFQVAINIFIVYHAILEALRLNWFCAPVDYYSPRSYFILKMVYVYFLTKLSDLLDTWLFSAHFLHRGSGIAFHWPKGIVLNSKCTSFHCTVGRYLSLAWRNHSHFFLEVFFVLRKKDKQITFLHVYHHFGMVAIGWIGVKFLGGGHTVYIGLSNGLVHIPMYFYYLLTIWKPEYKRSIWWKKYITQMQLAQFFFNFITYGQLLFKPDCPYPKIASWFVVPQNIFLFFLFADFYYESYVKTKKSADN